MPHKVMTRDKFKVERFGWAGNQIAGLTPPFDVVTVFRPKTACR